MRVNADATSVITYWKLVDPTAFTPETGLTIADLDLTYTRDQAAAVKSDLVAHGAVTDAWDDNEAIEIDGTNTPGQYRVDIPDAAFAAGVDKVQLCINGAAIDPAYMEVEIGPIPADVIQVSGDATAADNLELQYDTTGLAGDTFPSSQSQLNQVANVSGIAKRAPASYTLTTGTQSANTVAATEELDGTRHEHTDTASGGEIDLYYEFNVGSGIATEVKVTGYLQGNNDDLEVYGYDWVSVGWKRIGTWEGRAAASNEVLSFDLLFDMVGAGANLGVVRVRFTDGAFTLTSPVLAIDQILVEFTLGGGDYENAAVWLNTNATNTNTVRGVDGRAANPVSTIAAVNTLLTKTGLSRVEVAPTSSITFAATQANQHFVGKNWTLALGGRSISGSYIEGAHVSGIGTGAAEAHFDHCHFGNATLPPSDCEECVMEGTITGGSAGDYFFENCMSGVAGAATPAFIFTGLASLTNIHARGWLGGSSWTLDSDCVVSHEVLVGGGQTFVTGGADVEIRGTCRSITLTLSGAGTVNSIANCGPVIISGTATTTVNLYGAKSSLADTSSGTTVNDLAGYPIQSVDSASTQLFRTGADADTGKTLSDQLDAVETDTGQIGTAGAGLTDLGGMSTGMKGQVQTEANDALVAQKLDHLVAVADADDPVNDSIVAKLAATAGDWSTFSKTTDSLQSARDKQTDIETDTGQIGTAGAGLTDLGGMSTGMKAEAQVEANDALVAINLDHLMKAPVASGTDMTTEVPDGTVLSHVLTKTGDTSTYDDNVHSLEGIATAMVSSGTGEFTVNHDKPTTDSLTYETAGAGIDNAVVRAFLTSDYDANNRADSDAKGITTTDTNGNWVKDIMLDEGSYTIEFFKQGIIGPDTQEITVGATGTVTLV